MSYSVYDFYVESLHVDFKGNWSHRGIFDMLSTKHIALRDDIKVEILREVFNRPNFKEFFTNREWKKFIHMDFKDFIDALAVSKENEQLYTLSNIKTMLHYGSVLNIDEIDDVVLNLMTEGFNSGNIMPKERIMVISEIFNKYKQYELPYNVRRHRKIKSLDKLKRVAAAELAKLRYDVMDKSDESMNWVPMPLIEAIPDEFKILTSPKSYYDEYIAMKHCILDYLDDAKAGRFLALHGTIKNVNEDGFTISFFVNSKGYIEFNQCYGKFNRILDDVEMEIAGKLCVLLSSKTINEWREYVHC